MNTSVNPKVIDCPDPAKGRPTLDGVCKKGIQLRARARVTVRTKLDRLVGGATEETIIARVGAADPGLFEREAMLRARNLYEFDNIVTAPLHGYRDTDDYWNRASAKHVLEDITVPTLVLNARNDPFLPPHHLPRMASRSVTLDYPIEGGHVGFAVGPLPGSINWLPQRIIRFLDGDGPQTNQAGFRLA